jgi:DNA-binding XRE family transcriptional regulator
MTVAAQMRTQAPVDEQFPDDIEEYEATFNEDEVRELEAANAAIDIAILLHWARTRRGLSQAQAAKMTGLKQQAISRLERPGANPRLASIEA